MSKIKKIEYLKSIKFIPVKVEDVELEFIKKDCNKIKFKAKKIIALNNK